MRPQHITAENHRAANARIVSPPGFNEAAAYHCGKPHALEIGQPRRRPRFNEAAAYHCGKPSSPAVDGGRAEGASMRPQHITAENHKMNKMNKWDGRRLQ